MFGVTQRPRPVILSTVKARLPKLRESTRKKALASILMLGSLIVTTLLVLKSGSHKPLPTLEAWLLGIMAAALQIAAGYTFSSVGKADPALAKSSVRSLLVLGEQAERARLLAERSVDFGTAEDRHLALGQLSVYLSVIEESASLAAQSWGDFHADAVADILKEAKETKGGTDA